MNLKDGVSRSENFGLLFPKILMVAWANLGFYLFPLLSFLFSAHSFGIIITYYYYYFVFAL